MDTTPKAEDAGRSKWPGRAQTLLGIAIAAVSIGVAVADFAGVLGGLSGRLPTFTLLLLGFMSSYLVFERQSELGELRKEMGVLRVVGEGILRDISGLRSSIRHVDSFFGAAASKGSSFDRLKLIYAAREIGTVISGDSLNLGREYIFPLWLDCLHNSRSFLAFNYVRPDEVWKDGWFEEVSISQQRAAAIAGTLIRRVFVVDSDAEMSALIPLMQRQLSAGIDVRWVYADEVATKPLAADYLRDLGTWDLIALDDDLLMRVYLDEGRSMEGCSVTRDPNLNAQVKYLVEAAYGLGHPPPQPPASAVAMPKGPVPGGRTRRSAPPKRQS